MNNQQKLLEEINKKKCSDCPPWDVMAGRCYQCVDLHTQEEKIKREFKNK